MTVLVRVCALRPSLHPVTLTELRWTFKVAGAATRVMKSGYMSHLQGQVVTTNVCENINLIEHLL
jgi:hypothetical protein